MAACLLAFAGLELGGENNLDLSVHELYSRFTPFAVSPREVGCFYDLEEGRLAFIAADGSLIQRVGRAGKGPGEFSDVRGVYWASELDKFVVFDRGAGRMSLWSEGGARTGETSLSRLEDEPRLFRGRALSVDNFAGPDLMDAALYVAEPDKGGARPIWRDRFSPAKKLTAVPGRRPLIIFIDWDARISFDVGADFIAATRLEDDKLYLIDLDGKPLLPPLPSGLPRLPTTDAHREAQIAKSLPRFRQALKKHIATPPFWPVIRRVRVDERNRVWVFGYSGRDDAPVPTRVFSRQGRMIAEGRAPFLPAWVANGKLYALDLKGEQETLVLRWRTFALPK